MSQNHNLPLVSAVIPTRNRPELVRRAVLSALNQTYRNLEVVVVIDGPDQMTAAALEALREPRVRIVTLRENVGGSEARNIGVREARGEWIAFLDDDDEWLPEKIEKQQSAARRLSDRQSVVVCNRFVCSPSIRLVMPLRPPHPGEPLSEYILSSPSHGYQTSCFFCTRELLRAVPWRKGLLGMQDFDWLLRATSGNPARLCSVEEPLTTQWEHAAARISTSLKWSPLFDWGRANRELMTRRAYSLYLVRICFDRAVSGGAGARVYWKIIREAIKSGEFRLRAAIFLLGYALVPQSIRLPIRKVLRGSQSASS